MNKILVIGGSGATGKRLVTQLLNAGLEVKVIVRTQTTIPEVWQNNEMLTIIRSNIHEMNVSEMQEHLEGCRAVASCLGHAPTLKGIFGKPKKLVTDAIRLVSDAIEKSTPEQPVKCVLMNTAGNSNRDLNEPLSVAHKMVIALIRTLVPPHRDNEQAADYLRENIGQNHPYVHWAVVRPDSLINQEEVTEYTVHDSPTRSALFNAGKTSRINVGHFMAKLITDDDVWRRWKGKMPVIYNAEPVE